MVNQTIQEMLDNEIRSEIAKLSELENGTKEMASAVEDVAKLYKLKLESEKNATDWCSHETDEQFKREQFAKDLISNKLKLGAEIGMFLLELAFAAYWAKRGFEFEKDGAFTSSTLKSLFSRFKFKKGN